MKEAIINVTIKVKYEAADGEQFDTEEEAKAYNVIIARARKEIDEAELRKQIYKNLFAFIQQHNIGDTPSEDVLEFLVVNKKEILLLLTNGNLDTKYAPRDFVKGE